MSNNLQIRGLSRFSGVSFNPLKIKRLDILITESYFPRPLKRVRKFAFAPIRS